MKKKIFLVVLLFCFVLSMSFSISDFSDQTQNFDENKYDFHSDFLRGEILIASGFSGLFNTPKKITDQKNWAVGMNLDFYSFFTESGAGLCYKNNFSIYENGNFEYSFLFGPANQQKINELVSSYYGFGISADLYNNSDFFDDTTGYVWIGPGLDLGLKVNVCPQNSPVGIMAGFQTSAYWLVQHPENVIMSNNFTVQVIAYLNFYIRYFEPYGYSYRIPGMVRELYYY